MIAPKDVLFRLFSIRFFEASPHWWNEPKYLYSVFQALEKSNLHENFKYFAVEEKLNWQDIGSWPKLLEASKSWDAKTYILSSGKKASDYVMKLYLMPAELAITIKITEPSLNNLRQSILDTLTVFAKEIHLSYAETGSMGPHFHVTVTHPSYPRQRPPRQSPKWPRGSLVDFVSRKYLEHSESNGKEVFNKLLNIQLPETAFRRIHNGLLTIHWAKDIVDGDLVAQARASQEKWLADILNWPIAPGFNAYGDQLVTLWEQSLHPPLTFYVEMYQHGYKAVVPNTDGGIDEALFTKMANWIKAGQLPDGTPLQQLNLILPRRTSALDVLNQAIDIGISNVLYVDEHGNLWNLRPPGLWLE